MKRSGPRIDPGIGHRAYRVTLRFSESEYQQLRENAENAGRTVSAFIRSCLQGKRIQGRPAPVPALNREAWMALARSAANLNQLTKAVHEGRVVGIDVDALRLMYREIQTLRQQLRGRR
jgi:hypothetical protein